MEPRFFKRGNNPVMRQKAEQIIPSMEPRFFKRGNDLPNLDASKITTAFN